MDVHTVSADELRQRRLVAAALRERLLAADDDPAALIEVAHRFMTATLAVASSRTRRPTDASLPEQLRIAQERAGLTADMTWAAHAIEIIQATS